jgi:hypothetical protein
LAEEWAERTSVEVCSGARKIRERGARENACSTAARRFVSRRNRFEASNERGIIREGRAS